MVLQEVSQETLRRKSATSSLNEGNPNSGRVQMLPQERNFWHCSKQLSEGARSSLEEARSDIRCCKIPTPESLATWW
jgi:hypothetical protein